MIQVLEEDQDGEMTLYEMSPAQPILPVILEAVAIDDTNTYKIQITHIQTNTITEAEIVTSEVNLDQQLEPLQAAIVPVASKASGGGKKRRSRATTGKRGNKNTDQETVSSAAAVVTQDVTSATNPTNLFPCLVCGRNFVSTDRLQSHEKTHTKTRPFKCIDCGKTFTVRYSLICHTRVHTRERPYSCNLCGSRFSQASSLKTHQIYKHTKDFPYACKFCGRGFISPGQKHEHVRRSHLKSNTSASSCGKKGTKSKSTSDLIEDEPKDEPSQTQNPAMLTACVQTNLSLPPDTIY